MKRRNSMRRTVEAANHDEEQMYCLERLCAELEHPDELRRRGACAAVSWLSRLVNLRAAADGISCEEGARQLFGATWSGDDCELACSDTVVSGSESIGALVESQVRAIELAIVEREQARRNEDDGGPIALGHLLN